MFIVGCRGERANGDERLIFEEYAFGGFILFRNNCREPRQISSLCRQLWDTTLNTPPFIAIDQEGGRVHRLPPPFTHFPAAAASARAATAISPTVRPRRGRRIGSGRNQSQFRAGAGCQFQSAKSDHRRPRLRRRAEQVIDHRLGLDARVARRRRHPLRQTLSRPWRHRERFPLGASRGDKIAG